MMHDGHRERLRNRALSEGLSNFADHEILELFLFAFIPRKDTNEIAHKLLNKFGSLSMVLEAKPEELITISGMTKNAGVFLSLLPEVLKAYVVDRTKEKKELSTVKDCGEYFSALLQFSNVEEFYMVCLNSKGEIIKRILLQQGIVNESSVYLRDVLRYATMYNSTAVVCAHNHPSANFHPSINDEIITKNLAVALKLINIPLLDHIIVANNGYYSFKRDGKLDEFTSNRIIDIQAATIKSKR